MKRTQHGLVLAAMGAVAAVLLPATHAMAATSLSQTPSLTYQTNGRVSAIVTIGDVIVIGGRFTSVRPSGAPVGVGEDEREHLAAFDAATGALLPWNPGTDGEVAALAPTLDGSAVDIGGRFGHVGGAARKDLAQVDLSTGAVTSWSPSAPGMVQAILPTADGTLVGGSFTTVNGFAQPHLARITDAGGLDPTWTTWTDDRVRAISLTPDGSRLLVGGEFTTVNGAGGQRSLVALSPTTGEIQTWQLHPGYPVYSFAFGNGLTYVGGNGSGGHVAAFDTASGSRLWTIQTDGGVQSVVLVAGVLVAGGHFNNVCLGVYDGATTGFHCPTSQAVRKKLVALDPTTGVVDPWNPSANSALGTWSLGTVGDSLLVGGDFTKIGAPSSLSTPTYRQQGFARFDLGT
jgi:trimeric autotransporter adhesin